MNPTLRESLDVLASWHELQSRFPSVGLPEAVAFHANSAADIRAAIVSADDATKNLLTFRHHLAERRKYEAEPVAITGFDHLEGKS